MTDNESDGSDTFNTVALMAATLRAGIPASHGKASAAWQEAISEAVAGYALMLASQQQIGRMIADASASAVLTMDEPPLTSPVGTH